MMERGTWCRREVARGRWRDEKEDLAGNGAARAPDLRICPFIRFYVEFVPDLQRPFLGGSLTKRQKLLAKYSVGCLLNRVLNLNSMFLQGP